MAYSVINGGCGNRKNGENDNNKYDVVFVKIICYDEMIIQSTNIW